jgi:DNA-binding SARP family transcriptional activator
LQQLTQDPDLEIRTLAVSCLRSSSGAPAATATPLLRIRMLGTMEVSVGGEAIGEKAWRGTRNRYLLAYLAVMGRNVSEDRLVDLFWDEEQEKGKKGLYNSLSNLRKALRPSGWPGEIDYFRRQREQIGFNPDADRWNDVEEFEKALTGARRQRGDKPQEQLREALALYQGPFLENCFMDWALQERARLENLAAEAFIWLGQLELEGGQPQRALESAQSALALDNCNQPAILGVMRAFMELRRPEEAIRLYEAASRRLKSELDIEPGIELFEAYQRARLS